MSGARSFTRAIWLISATLAAGLAGLYVAAGLDMRLHDGQVLRGTYLGDLDVGAMRVAELDEQIAKIDSLVQTAPVYIQTSGPPVYEIPAQQLGLQLDVGATRAAVLRSGRDGALIFRPFSWLGRIVSPVRVDGVMTFDPDDAEVGLAAVSRQISVEPGDPELVVENGRLELEAGSPGNILDVPRLLTDLSAAIPSEAGEAITVTAHTSPSPTIPVSIQALVDRLNGFTTGQVEFVTEIGSVLIEPSELRSWLRLDLSPTMPLAYLDAPHMFGAIDEALGIGAAKIDTRSLVIVDNQVRLPTTNSTVCCSPETPEEVMQQILSGHTRIHLDLLIDDHGPLVRLGLSELLAAFTTQYEPDQSRVRNIWRMADIVRGAIIEPGETFSLNDYVGPRTVDAGFVSAGVIYDGVFADDVGGGVSQFATTLFNAAFFGGLDIVDTTAHSIYIDRYPYGREATVNYPSIDLVIRNPGSWPILIWTEYTDSTITVKLFGSSEVSGRQSNQSIRPEGECTRVVTERTRTWSDGRIDLDTFEATYQPDEGKGCDGKSTVHILDCAVDEGVNGAGEECDPAGTS